MLYSALSEFPILAIASIGFYISLRFLQFPDLTVDASFMLGMSVLGLSLKNGYHNEMSALIMAPIVGAIVGMITGFLHTSRHLSINKFLSGMLVAFATYSVCFRMCGQADLSLYEYRSGLFLFQIFDGMPFLVEPLALTILVIMVWFSTQRLLNTPYGLAIRTAGHRPDILRVSGLNPNSFVVLGLAFSNAIVAVAGWLNAVVNRNVSLKNFGIVINVLAACLIGDFILHVVTSLFVKRRRRQTQSIFIILLSPIIGAFVYSLIKSFVIKVLSGQLTITVTTDLQLVIALCIVLAILAGKQIGRGDILMDKEGI